MPETGPDQFLAIARIVRPQGRRGEVVAEILTDFPERFEAMAGAYLEDPSGQPRSVVVESSWPHKGRIVLKFSGVDSIGEADRLRGLHVFIRWEDRVALPEHSYYVWELEGCHVVRERDGAEEEVGVVTAVERTGGVDLLRVSRGDHGAPGSSELLVPLTQDICARIDTAAKTIVINPPDELLELNE